MSAFTFTAKQAEAMALLGGPARHILLAGGSRSGKTFLLLRAIAVRALKSDGSRHAVLRFRFNHLLASILADTWPKMLDLCFPGLRARCKDDRHAWFTRLPNGSEVWWGGLDDKDRVEKVLGQEYATLYLNECSQISWDARCTAVTRVAQVVAQTSTTAAGNVLEPKVYYDANPPGKGHWLYRLFHEHVEPTSRHPVPMPGNFAHLLMNPVDNRANLSAAYLEELAALPKRQRDRFYLGKYADENPNALFSADDLEKWRHRGGLLPAWQRVIVAVDPSGASDETDDADAIGIVVVALGTDGHAYVLEDLTVTDGPATWGKIAVQAAVRHGADCIVGERNYGGAMVEFVIKTAQREAGRFVRYREVVATRGKVVRAEPIAALVEQGRVRLVGEFPDLEEEIGGFSTTGYTGAQSPNRADACFWGITELFPALTVPHAPAQPRDVDDGYGYTDDGSVEAWKVA